MLHINGIKIFIILCLGGIDAVGSINFITQTITGNKTLEKRAGRLGQVFLNQADIGFLRGMLNIPDQVFYIFKTGKLIFPAQHGIMPVSELVKT